MVGQTVCGTLFSSLTDKVRYHPRGLAGDVVSGTDAKKAGSVHADELLSCGAARLDSASAAAFASPEMCKARICG
jgi:hypothetical protein